MPPFLNPIKQSIWLRIAIAGLVCGILSTVIWAVGTRYLVLDNIYIGLITGVIATVVAVILGLLISGYAMKSLDFLSRAILLVTRDESHVQAPDPNTLGPSKQFLADLAQSVYELASQSSTVKDSDTGQLPFFKSLAGTLPLPIITLKKDQVISYVNEAAVRYLALPENDITGKPLYDVMNLSFVSDLTLEAWLIDCAKNSIADVEVWERVRLNLPDNKRKQFDLSAHFSSNDPNGLETIMVLFDRTLQYERDDHDLTFVSLAVHELRTPLTIMRGYIEVFEDELSQNLNSEQTGFMHNMSASAQQLTSFVSNILNVARVEENALILNLKEEPWAETLRLACHDMELRANVHNKKLVFEIAENLPTVAVDKVSIYEVMANLIDNAVKYTHTDEDILIKSYLKDGQVETTVTDKGVGIPESVLGHVFDKFYRAHQNKNSISGTGLGLFLSRSIINAHGGTVWVQSKEGSGSTFGFTLLIYSTVANQIKNDDNGNIVRGAHGWIKNHSLYRE